MRQLEYPGALYVYLLCSADFDRHLYAINPAFQIFFNKRPAQRILTLCEVNKGVALSVCRGQLAGCSNKQYVIRECPKMKVSEVQPAGCKFINLYGTKS